jgi:hypothetical protein
MKTIMKERFITPQQIKALQAQFHKMGFTDEDRHGFISQFTAGRTDSTSGLTKGRSRTATEPLQQGISRPHT